MEFKTSLLNYLTEQEANDLVSAMENEEVTHCLLLNTKKLSDEEFVKRYPLVQKHPFVKHAYYYDKEVYDFGKNIFYDNGVFSIQDASAMMVPFFLNPEEDDVILDICAAPGGKSIGCSLAMNDKGCIIANDISYPRAKAMSQNVERMGRGDIIVASNDFVFSYTHFQNTFDKIIVDAPCSGSAMMRKNDLAKNDWSVEKVKRNSKKQLEILEYAYMMLKEGGTLVYSTCSFSYEEDEGTLLAFKTKHPELEFVAGPIDDPSFHHGRDIPESIYLYPHKFRGEGQFLCLVKKPGVLRKYERKVEDNSRYKLFIEDFGLKGRSNEMMRSKFYSLYQHFDVSHLNILRYGVKLFEMRDIYIPDHHLAHFLTPDYSIPLSLEDAKAYIRGETFPLDRKDGFYIISYDSQNLGFVKVTQGIAKNHYPKGLRRDWDPNK